MFLNEPFAIAALRYFGLIVDEYRIVNKTHKCHLGQCYVNQAHIVWMAIDLKPIRWRSLMVATRAKARVTPFNN